MSTISKEEAQFNTAVGIVQSLPKDGPVKINDDSKLAFYKYYKIATVGEPNIPRPGMLDFVGKAKWDAWKAEWDAGTRKEKAWTDYVSKLLAILKGVDTEDTKKWIAEIESAS